MTPLLYIWLALLAFAALVTVGRPREGGALTLSYFLGLSLIHVPGALVFTSKTLHVPGEDATRIGFSLTLVGMTAFLAAATGWRIFAGLRRPPLAYSAEQALKFEALGWRALTLGAIAYFVLLPVASKIPSITSLVAATATLLIVGLWLRFYGAAVGQSPLRTIGILGLLPLLPLATLSTGGFIGFGVNWVISVITFLYALARQRIWFVLAAPIVAVFGLSLFVAYMGERTGIRDTVWIQRAGITDRLGRISTIATSFKTLDLNEPAQQAALNERLNQNYLDGMGVQRHRQGSVELLYGGTVQWWALIPRVIWPDKPAVGGGGELVTAFTGLDFAQGTSVGVGQVLEFYMNFGEAGVIIGFAALGLLLMHLDLRLMQALRRGDMRAFLTSAMPGLAMLNPQGNLLEIVVAVVAAYVVARLAPRLAQIRPAAPPAAPPAKPALARR